MTGAIKRWASRYQSVWNNKPYIYLLAVAFLSLSGDLIAAVATTWTLTTATSQPAFYLTASIVVTQAAFVVASPVMGYVVDKYGPLRSLIGATIARAVVIAFLAAAIGRIDEGMSPWVLIALLGLDYAITPISRTGEFVLIQVLVPEEDLNTANALQGIQYDLGFIVGPILGGLFADQLGVIIGWLVNIASFAAYGLVVWWLIRQGKGTTIGNVPEESAEAKRDSAEREREESKEGFWASFKDGLRFLAKTPPLPLVIAVGFLWNVLLFGPLGVLNPLLATELLDSGAFGYGLLTAANAAGFSFDLLIIGGVGAALAVSATHVVAFQGLALGLR